MIATILTAAAIYVATGIDYLVILILLFSQVKKGQVKHIWIGQYIGTAIVIGASLLVAQGIVNLIPQQWVIGLLGLLPLYLIDLSQRLCPDPQVYQSLCHNQATPF